MKTPQYKLFKMKHAKIILKTDQSINELWNTSELPDISLIGESEVQKDVIINIWRNND